VPWLFTGENTFRQGPRTTRAFQYQIHHGILNIRHFTACPSDSSHRLLAINAVQLAIALISNFFLLMNMARRVRFAIAQPITIIGWYVETGVSLLATLTETRYISSFTLIGLTACASGPLLLEPKADHAFTQAFYYALFSAVLYFLVATLMLATVWGAHRGHYEKVSWIFRMKASSLHYPNTLGALVPDDFPMSWCS
jgi:hypothetical protein